MMEKHLDLISDLMIPAEHYQPPGLMSSEPNMVLRLKLRYASQVPLKEGFVIMEGDFLQHL